MSNIKTIERNGSYYRFGAEGYTVQLQECEGDYFVTMCGVIASSIEDAIEQAKLWYGMRGVVCVKVYRGNYRWYSADECIYEAVK